MSVELVIFDMDGVVIDSEKVYFEANRLAAEELGIEGFTMDYYRQFVGAGTENMINKMTEDYGDRMLIENFVRLSMDKIYPVVEAGKLALRPGFTELSAYLQEEEIPFTLASSNYKKDILYYLDKVGVKDDFKHIISADDVKKAKPAPDIFNAAWEISGSPEKEKTLIIEDSHNGILAANNAGIPVIMVPDIIPAGTFERENTVAVLDDLVCVKNYIEKKNK